MSSALADSTNETTRSSMTAGRVEFVVIATDATTNEVEHFWNTESRWLENLLYLYTEPADIVIDPFAVEASPRQTINPSPTSLGTRQTRTSRTVSRRDELSVLKNTGMLRTARRWG